MRFIPLESMTKFLENKTEEGFYGEISIKMQDGIIGHFDVRESIRDLDKEGNPVKKIIK